MSQPNQSTPRHWAGTGVATRSRRADRGTGSSRRGGRRRRGSAGPGGLPRPVLIAAGVVAAVVIGLGGLAYADHGYLFGVATPLAGADYEGPGGEEVQVEIPEGANGAVIAGVLVDSGVVASAGAFEYAFENNPEAPAIQPGTHTLQLQLPAAEAVALLAANEVDRGGFTVPEGLTKEQIRVRMIESGWAEKKVNAAFEKLGEILPPQANETGEGWLFPETYEVSPDKHSPSDVLQEMVTMTVSQLDEAGVPEQRREEILIKASLIEREARLDKDRPVIAGIIERRLEQDWKLGIDATVLYGVGRTSGALTQAELDDASNLYNSRIHHGLPPTPIANPGRASIDAALNPAGGLEMYWVTVNHETGETKFATTDAEFQALVAELRAWEAAHPDWHE